MNENEIKTEIVVRIELERFEPQQSLTDLWCGVDERSAAAIKTYLRATGKAQMHDSQGIEITHGNIISCTTSLDEKIVGEVMAFDDKVKMLFLKADKRQTAGDRGTDVVVLNMEWVKESRVLQNASVQPRVPTVSIDTIKKRTVENESKRRQAARRVNRNVPAHAQSLFNYLHSLLDNTRWAEDGSILVNHVTIRAPYTDEHVEASEADKADYVRKQIRAFQKKNPPKQSNSN